MRRVVFERRERNRELAMQDAAQRCEVCKRAPAPIVVTGLLSRHKFCSQACAAEYFAQERQI